MREICVLHSIRQLDSIHTCLEEIICKYTKKIIQKMLVYKQMDV